MHTERQRDTQRQTEIDAWKENVCEIDRGERDKKTQTDRQISTQNMCECVFYACLYLGYQFCVFLYIFKIFVQT